MTFRKVLCPHCRGNLESDQEPRKYTVDELIELKQFYKAKLKEMRESA